MNTGYVWRPSHQIAYLSKVTADIFGQRLERLRKRLGPGVTPKEVVEDARPDNSDIHLLFEWDNSTAAEKFREHQGRNALNSLRVVKVVAGEAEEKIVNVHIQRPEDGKHVYLPAEVVAERPDYLEQAVEELRRYIIGFQRRYGEIKELTPLVSAVAEAVEKYAPRGKARKVS